MRPHFPTSLQCVTYQNNCRGEDDGRRQPPVDLPDTRESEQLDDPGRSASGVAAARRRPARRRATTKASGARRQSDTEQAAEALREKLTDDMQSKLEEYVDPRKENGHFSSKQDQAAIIAMFLEETMGISEGISAQELGVIYDVMGWHEPGNPRAVINNARERNNYFRGWSGGRAKLTATGRNFARHDALQATTTGADK